MSLNRDRLVADAKETALALVRGGWRLRLPLPPKGPRKRRFACLAKIFLAAAKLAIHMMLRGGYVSEYDALVARKLAHILAGGASPRRNS